MVRAGVARFSALVLAAVVAGACGSGPGTPGTVSATTVPSLAPLHLEAAARDGVAAMPSGANAALAPLRPQKYVLDVALPGLGATAAVFRLHAQPVGADDARHVAQSLGLDGAPYHDQLGWHVMDADSSLSIFTGSGSTHVSYSYGTADVTPGSTGGGGGSGSAGTGVAGAPPVVNGVDKSALPTPLTVPPATGPVDTTPATVAPVGVPDASAAETIARATLGRAGLLQGQEWSTRVEASGGVAYACPAGLRCPPPAPSPVDARTVTFSLQVGGRTVTAVGWSVTVGAHGRITSVEGDWATAVAIGDYPLRTTADAFADLQHGTAVSPGPIPMAVASSGTTAGASVGTTAGAVDIAPSKPPVAPLPPGPATTSGPAVATAPRPIPATPPTVTVHVVGVTMGLARWDAFEKNAVVVDLVPVYEFRLRVDGGQPYDFEVLAVAHTAATFTTPSTAVPPVAQPGAPGVPGAAPPSN